jgi:hypothetical protein
MGFVIKAGSIADISKHNYIDTYPSGTYQSTHRRKPSFSYLSRPSLCLYAVLFGLNCVILVLILYDISDKPAKNSMTCSYLMKRTSLLVGGASVKILLLCWCSVCCASVLHSAAWEKEKRYICYRYVTGAGYPVSLCPDSEQ